jgi:hypothetical protein
MRGISIIVSCAAQGSVIQVGNSERVPSGCSMSKWTLPPWCNRRTTTTRSPARGCRGFWIRASKGCSCQYVAVSKGTMSEGELHVLRARPDGGVRNKAAKGELRRGLRVGFVWGEEDGELRFYPDEAVGTAIRQVCPLRRDRLGPGYGCGSARSGSNSRCRCVKAGRSDGPRRAKPPSTICSPIRYAGAYSYGRTRQEIVLDAAGGRKKRLRHLPRAEDRC